jgi:hypothetical protein
MAQKLIYERMITGRNKRKDNQDIDSGTGIDQSDIQHRRGTLKKDGDNDDPLYILKIRLAKGEITKAEYEEMRKIIESQ